MTGYISTVFALVTAFIADVCYAGQYCYYLHEDYYTFNQKYCESGCCKDYGDDDEICCFSWTVGIILGICFACIGFIALVVFLIICCYTMKKRSRTGQVVNPAPPQNNMVVYTSTAGYAYPHPPSAFYPPSRFPGTAPPPYTAGTQPAYPPTQMDDPAHAPPLPTSLYGTTPTAPQSNQPNQPYSGYGTGQT